MEYNQIIKHAAELSKKLEIKPSVGVILGSGLGGFQNQFKAKQKIPFSDIPGMPISTVQGHEGAFIVGKIGDTSVIAVSGRQHYYEGYSLYEVTIPVRILKHLGVQSLIITNAAGSVNDNIPAGEIVMIKDHINMMPDNPLRTANNDLPKPRFPDMSKAYDRKYIEYAQQLADNLDITLATGVYLALQGPSLETPAEYRMARILGADLVGMSTVPEVIAARQEGLKVAAFSAVTNSCFPFDNIPTATHEQVLDVSGKITPNMSKLISNLIPLL
jgi:purine-nucleoside phosphorylase